MDADRHQPSRFAVRVFKVLFFVSLYVLMRGFAGADTESVDRRAFNPSEIASAVSLAVSGLYLAYSFYRSYFQFVADDLDELDGDGLESESHPHGD
ncbi:hypothetical protein J5N97_021580 [Dioscorea zingiberensis]|uniref:Uncharacterized protein n=1 Tax=Dioscorea zingiberensis TaxID=325984 RepID=A0A9D5HA68_9LILI|nr:hypothetical protein J5N97_021580 [Dioscorea zingiberensis]